MREGIVYVLLIGILIILFAFVFAILGRGEYEPTGSTEAPYLGSRSTATS